MRTAPYGAWVSPITADAIASGVIGLSQPVLDGDTVYWVEARPTEQGRNALMALGPDGRMQECVAAPYNVRTRVHEYGGGAYDIAQGEAFFTHFGDQRIYRARPGREPVALTGPGEQRYADLTAVPGTTQLLCVREDHAGARGGEPINSLVSVDTDNGDDMTVAMGRDFYASPAVSPDGARLAWLCWDHPNMPWDGSELWIAERGPDGAWVAPRRIAGGPRESIFQPQWAADGWLYFVSDRSGWWNLYRWRGGRIEALAARAAEFGLPQWVFGMSTYAVESPRRVVCCFSEGGVWRLATLSTADGRLETIDLPYTDISGVRAANGRAVFLASGPALPAALVRLDLDSGHRDVLRASTALSFDPGYISSPEAIDYVSTDGQQAHAFFYPPVNKDFQGPAQERPPLLVKSHGGPTAATSTGFNPKIQFWTSRGFAVLDVNYGGSTGYGRGYRERLNGAWGVVDVDDCAYGARELVARGLVDGARLAISGGSAGGYTTLCALTFRDVFSAGASHYGISELEALVRDTHKFESRYLDTLVGPYPETMARYRERSPIYHTERLSCPIVFFQGLEDKVVPPNQAEMMVQALRAKGLPVAYVAFEGEQHGFRRAENIKRALEGELYFYSALFGFTPADTIEPLAIENLVP